MPIDKIVRFIKVVVSAIQNDRVRIEILVILQREFERVRAIVIESQIQNVDWSCRRSCGILRQPRLQLRRKILSRFQTETPRRAAAENGDALFAWRFATERWPTIPA